MARRNKPSSVPIQQILDTPSVPNDDKVQRKCWCCKRTNMIPHKPVYTAENTSSSLWFFKCLNCEALFQWVLHPQQDGSYAQKHKLDGGYSVKSMMSDPDNKVFTEEEKMNANTPVSVKPGDIIFVEDEYGNKTHRWHWGRNQWVRIGNKRGKKK